jgi:hypothetical protein
VVGEHRLWEETIVTRIATAGSDKPPRQPAEGRRSPEVKDATHHPLVEGKPAHAWLEANLSAIDANAFFSPWLGIQHGGQEQALSTKG